MATAIKPQGASEPEPTANEATLTGGQLVLKQEDGRPIAVLLPWTEYQALLDRLEDLADRLEVHHFLEERQRDPSIVQPWEEVTAELAATGAYDEPGNA